MTHLTWGLPTHLSANAGFAVTVSIMRSFTAGRKKKSCSQQKSCGHKKAALNNLRSPPRSLLIFFSQSWLKRRFFCNAVAISTVVASLTLSAVGHLQLTTLSCRFMIVVQIGVH